MIKKIVLLAALLLLLDGSAYSQNVSQTPTSYTSCSGTIASTNVWQRVLAQNGARKALLFMNIAANNQGWAFMPIGNTAAPSATGIGSAGVFTLVPNWSYEPDGGFIWAGEVWVIGTSGDAFTCGAN